MTMAKAITICRTQQEKTIEEETKGNKDGKQLHKLINNAV